MSGRGKSSRRQPKRKFGTAFPATSAPVFTPFAPFAAATPSNSNASLAVGTLTVSATTLAASKRSSGKKVAIATVTTHNDTDERDDDIAMEARSLVAVLADTEATAASEDPFWLAQLLDDVTHEMLATGDASVRVTWLNKVDSGDSAAVGTRYAFAFDDALEVDSILCHVYALECDGGAVEVTAKSMARVRVCASPSDCLYCSRLQS